MPPADHEVTLLRRANCHLCEQARDVLARVAGELGTPWREVDVDADPELQATYGDLVPVVLIDQREHTYYRIEEHRLRTALAT
jgi:glutaredoxin